MGKERPLQDLCELAMMFACNTLYLLVLNCFPGTIVSYNSLRETSTSRQWENYEVKNNFQIMTIIKKPWMLCFTTHLSKSSSWFVHGERCIFLTRMLKGILRALCFNISITHCTSTLKLRYIIARSSTHLLSPCSQSDYYSLCVLANTLLLLQPGRLYFMKRVACYSPVQDLGKCT